MAKKIVSHTLVLTVLFLANFAIATDGEPVDSTANVEVTLNNLKIIFDSQTGNTDCQYKYEPGRGQVYTRRSPVFLVKGELIWV